MIRRVIGWGSRRFGGGGGPASIGARALRSAGSQLRPARAGISVRKWLLGEYGQPLPPAPQTRAETARRLRRSATVCIACALLAAGPLTLAAASAGPLLAAGPLSAAAALAAAGLYRDYLAWQAANGRQSPPVAYLRKCPAVLFRR